MAKTQTPKRKGKPRVQTPSSARSTRRGLDRRWYVAIAVAAVVIVGVLVGVSQLSNRSGNSSGSGGTPAASGTTLPGAAQVASLFKGIPQSGATLGSANAPVTLVEYADPQCPYCAAFAAQALPDLVNRYVRPGKVKLVFRGVPIIGPQSVGGLQAVYAAGRQNKLWNLLDITYLNQGTENTGWLNDAFIRSAAGSVPGLDVGRLMSDRSSSTVKQEMQQAIADAQAAGVNGTPTFQAGRSLTSLGPPFGVPTGSAQGVEKKIDPLLGQ